MQETARFQRYQEILDRARKAHLKSLSAWYSLFGMKEDPFTAQIAEDELDFFVNRERIIDMLVFDVGVASRGIPILTFLVGPEGSGRSSILLFVQSILNKLNSRGKSKHLINGKLLSTEVLFATTDDPEEVQLWVKLAKDRSDFLFVDDAGPNHISTILKYFASTHLKAFVISPLQRDEIISSVILTPKVIHIDPMNRQDAIEMLNKRIGRVVVQRNEPVRAEDLFEQDALKSIHHYTMGVPGLTLKCCSRALQLIRDTVTNSLSPAKLKVTNDIAIQACRIEHCLQAVDAFEDLSGIKLNVLEQVLFEGKTPTQLSSILRKDRTTISRHLSELRQQGLVLFNSRGRDSVYQATLPTRVRYEISKMPKEVWKFG